MKLFIPCLLFFLATAGFAQEVSTRAANVAAPEQASKISLNDYKSFSKGRFRSDMGINANAKNIYKNGNIIVAFWDLTEDDSYKRTLDQVRQEGLSLMTKQQVVDESAIKTINGSRILVFRYHEGNEYSYRFYSEMKKNTGISGLVHFMAADRAKADAVFSKLLNSIKLKN